MNPPYWKSGELLAQLSALEEGDLPQAEQSALLERLADDAKARSEYLEYVVLQTLLRRKARRTELAVLPPPSSRAGPCDMAEPCDLSPATDEEPAAAEPAARERQTPSGTRAEALAAPLVRADGILGRLVNRVSASVVRPTPVSLAVALLVMVGIVTSMAVVSLQFGGSSTDDPPVAPQMFAATDAATLTGLEDCRWPDGIVRFNEGDSLRAGDAIEIERGLARIVFRSGAIALVQGPASLEVQSPRSARVASGTASFYVFTPEGEMGSQFTVITPAAHLEDLGTDFGVYVGEDQATLLHVFEGRVEIGPRQPGGRTPEDAKRILHAGELIRIEMSGATRDVRLASDATQDRFVRARDFSIPKEYRRWTAYSRQLRRRDDVAAYYSFEKDAAHPDRLQNEALMTQGRFDGSLGDGARDDTKPAWSHGRWPGKSAMFFDSSRSQRIVVRDWKYDRPERGMTLAAWVRQSRDRRSQTLVTQWATAGELSHEKHLFHLNIRDSDITLEMLGPAGAATHERRGKTVTTAGDGWVHVAMSIEPGGAIRLYENGKEIDLGDAKYDRPTLPTDAGPLVIGGQLHGGSCFSGWMDELVLFHRVLSQAELIELYTSGEQTDSAASQQNVDADSRL